MRGNNEHRVQDLASSDSSRAQVAASRRIVVKLGTRVLVKDDGKLAGQHVKELVGSVARLTEAGRQVIIVSSGAVGLGQAVLGYEGDLRGGEKRACAAVGQAQLVGRYNQELAEHGLICAQVLVTEQDFEARNRYLDLKNTLNDLLREGVVPVVNDNDAVSHGASNGSGETGVRAVFDDNDRLAALVAAKCEADLLVMLTDVDAVYDRNPKKEESARRLMRLDEPASLLGDLEAAAGSSVSRGGMRSKVEAAIVARAGGCQVVIASGSDHGVLGKIVAGNEVGTWIPADSSLSARRQWIGFAAVPRGAIGLDVGAVRALREYGASLLPVGVTHVEGAFQRGDVVELIGPNGGPIGRAWIDLDAHEVREWCEGRPPADRQNCLVRRDDIVLGGEQ